MKSSWINSTLYEFNPFRNKSGAQTYEPSLGCSSKKIQIQNILLSKIKDRSQLLQTICDSDSLKQFFVLDSSVTFLRKQNFA